LSYTGYSSNLTRTTSHCDSATYCSAGKSLLVVHSDLQSQQLKRKSAEKTISCTCNTLHANFMRRYVFQ